MRKGKMIAQGAHASLKVLLDAGELAGARFALAASPATAAWLGGRFTKVCVSVDSEAALDAIVERARAAGVPCALIVDAGRTEFHGVPTKTCCAVGPAWSDEVDAITGALVREAERVPHGGARSRGLRTCDGRLRTLRACASTHDVDRAARRAPHTADPCAPRRGSPRARRGRQHARATARASSRFARPARRVLRYRA